MALFVGISEQGPAWREGTPMREQPGWTDHAQFMNALTDDGLVVLGGPLGPGHPHRALLVLRAPDEATVRSRLAADPWYRSGVLRLVELTSWQLLLGELRES